MSSKRRFLCKTLPQPHHPVKLEEFEAHHATRVLRLGNGAMVEALDGQGHAAVARLKVRGEDVWLEHPEDTREIESIAPASVSSPKSVRVILELAMLKGDAMQWAIEKAVELDVDELVPVITDFTVIQIKSKGADAFQARWQKAADQALKQCGRLKRMDVRLPQALEELPIPGEKSLRCWCNDSARKDVPHLVKVLKAKRATSAFPGELRLLVGPEGGWSEKEQTFLNKMGSSGKVIPVSLGSLVLRAETAAIHGVSLILGALVESVG